MESPLTKEQIKKISEISRLSPEEQKKVLPEFLKTLNDEQIEFLKNQQKQKCIFCSIVQGEIPCKKIYEDEYAFAFLDINPVNKGHTLIVPKKHYTTLLDTPDDLLAKLISVTKNLSTVLMKSLNATGFNVNINNYSDAGQVVPHLHIHIIPRFSGDGHKLWNGRSYESEEEINSVLKSIEKNIRDVRQVVEEEEMVEDTEEVEKELEELSEDDEELRIP